MDEKYAHEDAARAAKVKTAAPVSPRGEAFKAEGSLPSLPSSSSARVEVAERWLNEIAMRHLEQRGDVVERAVALEQLGLSRAALRRVLPDATVDRVFVSLFVYSVGLADCIQEVLRHARGAPALAAKVWRSFLCLLEQVDRPTSATFARLLSDLHTREAARAAARHQSERRRLLDAEEALKQERVAVREAVERGGVECERLNGVVARSRWQVHEARATLQSLLDRRREVDTELAALRSRYRAVTAPLPERARVFQEGSAELRKLMRESADNAVRIEEEVTLHANLLKQRREAETKREAAEIDAAAVAAELSALESELAERMQEHRSAAARAAAAAKQRQSLQEQIATRESEIERLGRAVAEQGTRFESLRAQSGELARVRAAREEQVQMRTQRLQAMENELAASRQQDEAAEAERQERFGELHAATAEVERLKGEAKELRARFGLAKRQAATLQERLDAALLEREEAARAQAEAVAERDRFEKSVAVYTEEEARASLQGSEAHNALAKAREHNAALEAQLAALLVRTREEEAAQQRAEAEHEQHAATLAARQQRAQEEQTQLAEQERALHARSSDHAARVQDLQRLLASKQASLAVAEAQRAAREAQLESLSAQLQHARAEKSALEEKLAAESAARSAAASSLELAQQHAATEARKAADRLARGAATIADLRNANRLAEADAERAAAEFKAAQHKLAASLARAEQSVADALSRERARDAESWRAFAHEIHELWSRSSRIRHLRGEEAAASRVLDSETQERAACMGRLRKLRATEAAQEKQHGEMAARAECDAAARLVEEAQLNEALTLLVERRAAVSGLLERQAAIARQVFELQERIADRRARAEDATTQAQVTLVDVAIDAVPLPPDSAPAFSLAVGEFTTQQSHPQPQQPQRVARFDFQPSAALRVSVEESSEGGGQHAHHARRGSSFLSAQPLAVPQVAPPQPPQQPPPRARRGSEVASIAPVQAAVAAARRGSLASPHPPTTLRPQPRQQGAPNRPGSARTRARLQAERARSQPKAPEIAANEVLVAERETPSVAEERGSSDQEPQRQALNSGPKERLAEETKHEEEKAPSNVPQPSQPSELRSIQELSQPLPQQKSVPTSEPPSQPQPQQQAPPEQPSQPQPQQQEQRPRYQPLQSHQVEPQHQMRGQSHQQLPQLPPVEEARQQLEPTPRATVQPLLLATASVAKSVELQHPPAKEPERQPAPPIAPPEALRPAESRDTAPVPLPQPSPPPTGPLTRVSTRETMAEGTRLRRVAFADELVDSVQLQTEDMAGVSVRAAVSLNTHPEAAKTTLAATEDGALSSQRAAPQFQPEPLAQPHKAQPRSILSAGAASQRSRGVALHSAELVAMLPQIRAETARPLVREREPGVVASALPQSAREVRRAPSFAARPLLAWEDVADVGSVMRLPSLASASAAAATERSHAPSRSAIDTAPLPLLRTAVPTAPQASQRASFVSLSGDGLRQWERSVMGGASSGESESAGDADSAALEAVAAAAAAAATRREEAARKRERERGGMPQLIKQQLRRAAYGVRR